MPWANKRRPPAEYINSHKAQRIIARDHGVCYLCGHDGATEVDHITPWSEWTRTDVSVHDAGNLAAVHGRPCAMCDRDCHADKSKAEAARGRRRASQRRAAQGKRPTEQHPGAVQSH